VRAKRPRYPAYGADQWLQIPRRGTLIACCDCHLTHLFRTRVKDGRVEISARVLPRNTASLRRTRKRKR
jgi:hypothetical protein